MANQSRIVALTQKLIRTNSENPGGTEKAVAQIVEKELMDCGFVVKTYEFAKDRTNVVGVLKGKNSAKSLLLTPHIDTVPAGGGWKHNPFGAEIFDGKIYGRGAADCKCNIAICLEVARLLKENNIKLDYDLIIAATADEEMGSKLGLIPLLEKQIIKPTQTLVMDVEGFKIAIMQKGVLQMKATVYGKKAHGAYPWKGENAVEAASKAIVELKNYEFNVKPHQLVHPPTINIGIIKGGEAVNIVPDVCEFTIDARYLPGMDADALILEIKKTIEKATKNYKLETLNIQLPYEMNRNSPLITKLEFAMKNNGVEPKIDGSEGATVMTFFQNYKIPAVSFGIGPDMAHQTDEYVEVDALVYGANVLLDFLKEF
ncbi:MAG: M20 family metallopeptidase [Nanoarchaeota archaeon]|nr:M20 family metallopeptidase [Nanoarchaeota archaeon]MBU4300688.1 M20 family metallopeptidase [Nanoarchaeota archaeon]MBU4451799.1 M20 family metallopeptidase [Nanoarchaeota archaeon]MCG2723472.1 M20 family metallopeptidase [archaeon]